MKIIVKLFRELIHRFPLHFIFLFFIVFIQGLLNAITVVAVAPITDFLLDRVDAIVAANLKTLKEPGLMSK